MDQLLIGVCTFRRPVMLKKCLESLALQSVRDGFPIDADDADSFGSGSLGSGRSADLCDVGIESGLCVVIVVVDNEPLPVNQELVMEFGKSSPFPVHYVHQPRRGIAPSRNVILDRAIELSADWVLMLDDDETAAPNWIEELMNPARRDVPVLMGRQIFVYPDAMPFWAKMKSQSSASRFDGEVLDCASTHNVRFSIRLAEAGLRFNERLGLMGGEDVEFFAHAKLLGFEIQRAERAITYETAHPERYTFLGQIYRSYWWAVSRARQKMILTNGPVRLIPSLCQSVAIGLEAMGILATCPLYALGGAEPFKRRLVSGAKRLARAAGMFAGYMGALPQPYQRSTGH